MLAKWLCGFVAVTNNSSVGKLGVRGRKPGGVLRASLQCSLAQSGQ
jgi:hypothetical protein